MNQRIKKFIFFFIILNAFLLFCTGSVFAGTESTDINGIDDNLYPGVKSKILSLQQAHPNWTFKVEYTGISWEEAINGEHQNHGAVNNPTNLVPAGSASYSGYWICEICGTEKCDTGSWYCASVEAIEYMMDPRNSINSSDVFQFLQLSSNEDYTNNTTVRNVLKNMASSTNYIDDECIEAIISAATTYHVDPYYIMAKIIDEQGTTVTPLVAGTGYNGSYPGVYNFFNIGATGNTGTSGTVILNGLAYASSQGWTTKTKAIVEGTRMISANYIAKEQDTLYYQKFNVVGSNIYSHQYQQNILGAQNGGTALQKLYKKMDSSLSGNYTFIIPLYTNMPSVQASRPATNKTRPVVTDIKMGDLNSDNIINILDVVIMIDHITGSYVLTGNNLEAAKVAGNSNVTILDVVTLINYLEGTAVLPSSSYKTATLNSTTELKLSSNGSKFASLSSGTKVKIISLGDNQINGIYWDLVVTGKGQYGYITRSSY